MGTTLDDDNMISFRDSLILEEKSERTIEKYMRDLRSFTSFMKERELSKEQILNYKRSLMERYAASSVNSMLVAVNRYLTFLNLSEYKVKLIKRQRKIFSSESQELTKNEYLKLLEAAQKKKDERLSLMIQTICATGIRISELKFFTVQALQCGKLELYNKGKSRVIFIPKSLRMKLKTYVRKKKIKQGAIFITKNQKPLDRVNIWRQMKRLCQTAGVPEEKVYPHNLRHLFARLYYKIEKDIIKLADILGHSSIDTTRIYTRTTGREHERQIEKLGLVT